MVKESWRGASLYERSIVAKIQLLQGEPEDGFVEQIQVTVAAALLVNSAAINSGIAVKVLSMLLTGRIGDKEACTKIRNRLTNLKRGISKIVNRSQIDFSSGSVKRRLESPFFLPPATSYPEVLTHTQQAKADSPATVGKVKCLNPNHTMKFEINA